ncbi:hypothetical protein HRD57_04365 [Tetragenococcus halophilus]|nr:hypothetical protein [Tetragenococcus halophilus]
MIKKIIAKIIKGKSKPAFIFPIQFKRRGAIVAPKLQPINTIALAVFKNVNGIFSGKRVKILETVLVIVNPLRKAPMAIK